MTVWGKMGMSGGTCKASSLVRQHVQRKSCGILGAGGTGAARRQKHDMSKELRSVKTGGDSRAGHMAKV